MTAHASSAKPTFRSLPISLLAWAALAMAVDIGVARVTYGAVLPRLARDLGLTYTSAGILSSVNLAAYLIGTLAAPSLIRVLGTREVAVWGHAAVAAGAIASGLAQEAGLLAVGRFLMGIGAGAGLVTLLVIVMERTAPALRTAASPIAWAGIGVGLILTGATLNFSLGHVGAWRYPFLVSAVAAAGIAIRLWFEPAPVSAAASPSASTRAAAANWSPWIALCGGYFMFGAGYIAYATFLGAKLSSGGSSVTTMAAAWIVLGVTSIVGCAVTVVALAKPAIKRAAFTAAMASGAVGSCLMVLDQPLYVFLAAAFVGLGLCSVPAVVTFYVRERTSAADFGRMLSIATIIMGIGQFIGPILAGALSDRFGTGVVGLLAGSAFGVGAVLAAYDGLVVQNPSPS
jgi:predicted MFS family arabinose efflux permease